MLQQWKDGATSNKDCLFEIGKGLIHPLALRCSCLKSLGVEVVPSLIERKCIDDLLQVHMFVNAFRSNNFRRNEEARAKHKLRLNVPEARLVRELGPHGAHDGFGCARGRLKGGVEVVDQVVALVDGVSDGLAHSRCLLPRLTILDRERQVDALRVCPHERIPGASLVEHDEQIVSWVSIEAWNVGAAKNVARIAQLHYH